MYNREYYYLWYGLITAYTVALVVALVSGKTMGTIITFTALLLIAIVCLLLIKKWQ